MFPKMINTILLLTFARAVFGLSYWVNETGTRIRALDTPTDYVGYKHENETGCGEEWCNPSIKDPLSCLKKWMQVRVSHLTNGGNSSVVKNDLGTNGACGLKQFHSAKYPLSDPMPLVSMPWHIWDSFMQSVPLNATRHNLLCTHLIEIKNDNGAMVTARVAGSNAPKKGIADFLQDKGIGVSSDLWVNLEGVKSQHTLMRNTSWRLKEIPKKYRRNRT